MSRKHLNIWMNFKDLYYDHDINHHYINHHDTIITLIFYPVIVAWRVEISALTVVVSTP